MKKGDNLLIIYPDEGSLYLHNNMRNEEFYYFVGNWAYKYQIKNLVTNDKQLFISEYKKYKLKKKLKNIFNE